MPAQISASRAICFAGTVLMKSLPVEDILHNFVRVRKKEGGKGGLGRRVQINFSTPTGVFVQRTV
jgi:hypothetical protein